MDALLKHLYMTEEAADGQLERMVKSLEANPFVRDHQQWREKATTRALRSCDHRAHVREYFGQNPAEMILQVYARWTERGSGEKLLLVRGFVRLFGSGGPMATQKLANGSE